jgi:hypothetical protein
MILLVISLLTTIATFSQTTYPKNIGDSLVIITAEQLKQANLVFVEHSYLLDENALLLDELDAKDEIIFNYHQMDSINRTNIIRLTNELDFTKSKVDRLNKKLNNHKTYFWVGGGALVAAIVAFFLK